MERPPAQPSYVLRGHNAQVHALHIYRDNTCLLTGDADGFVVIWDMVSKRPIAVWRAHQKSILTLRTWGCDKILSHGRDDALRVWQFFDDSTSDYSKVLPVEGYDIERKDPWLLHSLLVNTLNFCSFAMCTSQSSKTIPTENKSLIAVPGANEGFVAIYELSSEQCVYLVPPSPQVKKSLVMAVKLLRLQDDTLCLVVGNEAGSTYVQILHPETNKWTTVYSATPHSQPVLSLDVASSANLYFTSSADAIITKNPLPTSYKDTFPESDLQTIETGHAGQQGVTVRGDDRLFATAGWDSRVRVYSVKTMKEMAVLKWHKLGCYSLSFGTVRSTANQESMDNQTTSILEQSENKETSLATRNAGSLTTVSQRREQKTRDAHWLAAGSKDGKVSLWEIF